ncbi:MAG TPA: NUDIX hydrolase N-terminal domain-containing protein [Euzebyales bacterium]|nr:NUDIX hydrolase N-terminal domain-containing protein [Euzebyales bacterium]
MDVFTLLDEIQTIARNGLEFTENPYDRERYERLAGLASQSYAERLALADAEVRERFARELGYITPKVGADAAIFDGDERLLVERRSDDGCWGLISGWVEPGESPAETVVREAREETGLRIAVRDLVGVIPRAASAELGPHAIVAVVYLCEVVGGRQRLSHEVTELAYRDIDGIAPWHKNHEQYARRALAVHRRRGC